MDTQHLISDLEHVLQLLLDGDCEEAREQLENVIEELTALGFDDDEN